MKIAVNTRFLLKDKLEGIGWFTYESVKRMVLAHPEHEFHFLFDRNFSEEFIFAKNVVPHVLFPPARHPFLWYAWFEYAVPSALRKIKPDVFLSTDGYLSLSAKTPQVLVIHDLAFEHFNNHVDWLTLKYYKYFVPKFARRANRIAAVSSFTKTDIAFRYNISPDKIDVTHNGSNEAYFPLKEAEQHEVRMKISGGAPYFIYAGAIHPRKNVGRLFQAFDKFRSDINSDFKLVVAGRKAWDTDEAMQTHSRMRYRDDVIFLGHLPQRELSRIMASAAALTYTSLFEGFGIPILEAMNSGIPVITSSVSSMPEVAGDAALLVNPESVIEIENAMLKIATNASLGKELTAKGNLQSKKFSWDFTADKLYQCILKSLS
ncbi:MAG TPA: glycosyltransferase family 1 protein [Bacteroidetes bacterium]|nr:glycosyltransferase family 1 protein [Bacteroidota bacterium]